MALVISNWLERIRRATKVKEDWEKKYKCAALEMYYEGFQWENQEGNPYTFNMFFSSIETKMPGMIFTNPQFRLTPKPGVLAVAPEESFQYTTNNENVLNDWVSNTDNHFTEEITDAVMDGWFRFGIVEVGYSASWLENPAGTRPEIQDKKDGEPKVLNSNDDIPVHERLFIRQIPAKQFVISTTNAKYLERADWCGYYEYYTRADLATIRGLKDKELLQGSNSSYLMGESYTENEDGTYDGVPCEKVWKIWDTRAKRHYIFTESGIELFNEPYRLFPFRMFRFKKAVKGCYPLPPTFNWVSPQNEINEVRQQNRVHRRKFKRLYAALKGGIDYDEAIKLVNGPDGGVVEETQRDSIRPIQNADLGSSSQLALAVSKDDMNIITGTTSEQRGESDRTTATQAAITNQRAQIRESREQAQVANFINSVAELLLDFINTKLVNAFTVQLPPQEAFLGEADQGPQFQQIDPLMDLGPEEMKYKATITLESTSPIANAQELEKLVNFVTILNQFPQIAMSPILIRELASRIGYKNERVIREWQQMAQLTMLGQVQQGAQGMGTDAAGLAKQIQPPNGEQMANQITSQLGAQ